MFRDLGQYGSVQQSVMSFRLKTIYFSVVAVLLPLEFSPYYSVLKLQPKPEHFHVSVAVMLTKIEPSSDTLENAQSGYFACNSLLPLVFHTFVDQIMLSCADEEETFHPLILPLAHGLALEVDGLGSKAKEYKPSLTITASSGCE